MTDRTCVDCGAPITVQSAGRCKSCAAKKRSADPAYRAKMSQAKIAALRDPIKRERVSSAARRNLIEFHEKRFFDWSAWHKQRQANRLSWCPAAYRAEYKSLRPKFGALEARRMIEEQMAAEARREVRRFADRQLAKAVRDRREAY